MTGSPTLPIFLSLDDIDLEKALYLTSKIGPQIYGIKIHNLFDKHGPEIVKMLINNGAHQVWMDSKLHDIPHTVGLRAKALTQTGIDILTVHASAGVEAMKSAVLNGPKEVYAVTVLTSLTEDECKDIYKSTLIETSTRLALSAKVAGVSGIVCSSLELPYLSQIPDLKHIKFVVPGIRSKSKKLNDQHRIGTSLETLKNGAGYIVIGRQITDASNPEESFKELKEELLR